MELLSTMGWNHIAIKERGLRDIWFRDNSDIYILYLDNTKDPETCRIVRMYDEPTSVVSGAYTLTKKEAEAFIKKLGDGTGFVDHNLNMMPEHRQEKFHLCDFMDRIFLATEYYKDPRGN